MFRIVGRARHRFRGLSRRASAAVRVETLEPRTLLAANAADQLTITPRPPIHVMEGGGVAGEVATFVDSNPAAQPSNFNASMSWFEGGPVVTQGFTPCTITRDSAGVFHVTLIGEMSFEDPGTYTGDHAPSLTITDHAFQKLAEASIPATVDDAPLESLAASPLHLYAGVTADKLILGGFFDSGVGYVARLAGWPHYSLLVDWGDGDPNGSVNYVGSDDTAQVGWLGILQDTVLGSHTYAQPGTYTIHVDVLEELPNQSATSFDTTVTVLPAPVISPRTVQATEGQQFRGVVASFTDPDPSVTASDFTAEIQWHNTQNWASGPTGQVVSDGHGGFLVLGQQSFNAAGGFPFTLKLTGPGGATITAQGQADVADPPFTVTPMPIRAAQYREVSRVLARFTDGNPLARAQDFRASVDWGDQTSSVASVVPNSSGGFLVIGSHNYTRQETFPVSITIADNPPFDGFGTDKPTSVTVESSAFVVPPPQILQAVAVPVTGIEAITSHDAVFGYFDTNLSPLDLPTAIRDNLFPTVIEWPVGLDLIARAVPYGEVARSPDGQPIYRFLVEISFREDQVGRIPVHVYIASGNQVPAGFDDTVQIHDAPLSAPDPVPPLAAMAGVPITNGLLSQFLDQGLNLRLSPSQYNVVVSWGDGSVPTTGAWEFGQLKQFENQDYAEYRVLGSHTFLAAGNYRVQVTVHDQGGSSLSLATIIHVAGQSIPLAGAFTAYHPSAHDAMTFQGTAQPGTTVWVFADEDSAAPPLPTGRAQVDAQGRWSLTAPVPAAAGNRFVATVIDTVGGSTRWIPLVPDAPGQPLVSAWTRAVFSKRK